MKFIIGVGVCLFLLACERNFTKKSDCADKVDIESININDEAELRVVHSRFDVGTIEKKKSGKKVIDFEIENIGKKPLIIYAGDVSCNCLSVDIPKTPILSGEKAKIRVYIDVGKVDGVFNKVVYIKSNAINDLESIRVKGFVK